jgi:hypothetical protein
MKSTIKTITPANAESLLKKNKNNRTVRPRRVDQYAKQIVSGQWQVTGEAIKIALDGSLLDGQHRLLAVIKAGIPTEFLVVEGLDPNVFKVLDSGLMRSAGDALSSVGFTSSKETASIARLSIAHQSGISPRNTELMSLITRSDIYEFCVNNRDLITDAVRESGHIWKNVAGSRSAWGTLYIVATIKHQDNGTYIQDFLNSVAQGANLSDGDPRLALRNWLARHPKAQEPVTSTEHLGTYITAYRNFATGVPTHRLRTYRAGGALPEIPERW